MASHVAASAFGHSVALVRDEETAAQLAVAAIRRGGHSLSAVLGHAGELALAHLDGRPPEPEPLPPDAGSTAVAWALARTRPAEELAALDAAGRYGLSREGLGDALRTTAAEAAQRVASTAHVWDRELDPALLAWLGDGGCPELTGVLEGRPRGEAGDLLALAGDVVAHTALCNACAERQRTVASVRGLLRATPVDPPPPEVVAAAAQGRHDPPSPPPPRRQRRRRTGLRMAAAVTAVAVGGISAAAVADRRNGADEPDASVEALTRLPAAAGSFRLAPAVVQLPATEVSLLNGSDDSVAWEAATDAAWLHVTPARGRLAPGRVQVIHLLGEPPEGDVRATVRVEGDDGSATASVLEGTVERPPDLGASAAGCRITAVVEDEGDVVLTLHWRGPDGEHTTVMAVEVNGLVADLPQGQAPLTWWVRAVDGRDNQARTPDNPLPGGC